jgi:hypothetical protein
MRVANYDRVEPAAPVVLPVRLTQTCARRSAAVWLALGVPAVLAVVIASFTLVGAALSAPGARAVLAQHPALGLEVLTAVAFWLYLLGLPFRRLLHSATASRSVEIGSDTVKVGECGYLRRQTWSAPLSSYVGLAHHLRASLSGTRHELILVHPERAKSVLVSIADTLPESELQRVAALLGQKVIPSSELYRVTARWRRLSETLVVRT